MKWTCAHCHKMNFTDAPLCSHCSRPRPVAGTSSGPRRAAPPPPRPVPMSPPLPPVPYRPSPAPTRPTTVWPPPGPPAATPRSPLPATFTRLGRPQLAGEVEDLRELHVSAPPNRAADAAKILLGLILLPLKPLLVLSAVVFRGAAPREKRAIYVLGVRKGDGQEQQARIESELVGAMPRRGDYISLWGVPRYGILVVSLGYNHSVGAEIRLNHDLGQAGQKMLGYVLLIVCIAVFLCVSSALLIH